MKIHLALFLALSIVNGLLTNRVFATEPILPKASVSPVAKVEQIKVTPLDVAQGYSAKYKIVLKVGDNKPIDWGADDYLWYRTLERVLDFDYQKRCLS